MALDRFVYWQKRRGPSLKRLREVLEDYLGGTAERIWVDGDRVLAVLKGRPSFPFKRVPEMKGYTEAQETHDERWIEIYRHSAAIDVITRMTDEYTNVVAEGFAALCARFWEGKREEDEAPRNARSARTPRRTKPARRAKPAAKAARKR